MWRGHSVLLSFFHRRPRGDRPARRRPRGRGKITTVVCGRTGPLAFPFPARISVLEPCCATCTTWAGMGVAGGAEVLRHHHPLWVWGVERRTRRPGNAGGAKPTQSVIHWPVSDFDERSSSCACVLALDDDKHAVCDPRLSRPIFWPCPLLVTSSPMAFAMAKPTESFACGFSRQRPAPTASCAFLRCGGDVVEGVWPFPAGATPTWS